MPAWTDLWPRFVMDNAYKFVARYGQPHLGKDLVS